MGAFDGVVSCVGVLAGLLAVHARPDTILTVSAGLAIAAAVGMAAGDSMSGSPTHAALVMGAATLGGSLLPALPLAWLPQPAAGVVSALVVVGIGAGIAETRSHAMSRARAYLTTGATVLVASALSALVAVGLGAVG